MRTAVLFIAAATEDGQAYAGMGGGAKAGTGYR